MNAREDLLDVVGKIEEVRLLAGRRGIESREAARLTLAAAGDEVTKLQPGESRTSRNVRSMRAMRQAARRLMDLST